MTSADTFDTFPPRRAPALVVVGSLNMDLVINAPTLPGAGQTVIGGPFATFGGGKGANQAVAAARAGAKVTMLGCVGDDNYGALLRAGLEAEGIDPGGVLVRAGVATGVAVIAVDGQGQNMILVAPGANFALRPQDVRQAAETIASAACVLLQLEVPLPVVEAVAEIASAAHVPVLLNPAPAQPLPAGLLAHIDVLLPNESEAAILSGIAPGDWQAAERAAHALQQQGARSVVVTLGRLGALMLHEGQVYRQPAYAVQAVDSTAAGDAFVGAFAVALAEGHTAQEALRRGAAAGALAVTQAGAQPSLPGRAAIDTLLAGR